MKTLITRIVALVGPLVVAAVAACDEPADLSGLGDLANPPTPIFVSAATSFTGTVSFVNDASPHLHSVVSIVNLTTAPDTVSYGGCWLYVRLYSTSDRSGTPVYDESAKNIACAAVARVVVIPPRDSTAVTDDLLTGGSGALAPPGHYYASLLIAPSGTTTLMSAGELDLP